MSNIKDLSREYKQCCEALEDGNKKISVIRKAKKQLEEKLISIMTQHDKKSVPFENEGWRVLKQDVKKRKTVGKNVIKSTFETRIPKEEFDLLWNDLYSDEGSQYDSKLVVDFYDEKKKK
ncbi:MAG: hypothetical protein N2B06_16905 [Clostridium sp.]